MQEVINYTLFNLATYLLNICQRIFSLDFIIALQGVEDGCPHEQISEGAYD